MATDKFHFQAITLPPYPAKFRSPDSTLLNGDCLKPGCRSRQTPGQLGAAGRALAAETNRDIMTEINESNSKSALKCIAIIACHFPLNDGEKKLLCVIANEIRLAFDLQGAVKPAPLQNEVGWAPREWFW